SHEALAKWRQICYLTFVFVLLLTALRFASCLTTNLVGMLVVSHEALAKWHPKLFLVPCSMFRVSFFTALRFVPYYELP
ncbi:MAG: hypothetical protein NZ781_13015, partial [Armatimonadetes bacterium]|nr:hypothetical protein [Armatimonadota bacterium]